MMLLVNTLQHLNIGIDVLRTIPTLQQDGSYELTASVAATKCTHEIIRVAAGDTRERNYLLIVDIGTTTVVAALFDCHQNKIIASKVSW